RSAPGMHHHDRRAEAEFFHCFSDHPRLHNRARLAQMTARAPAVSGTIDQNHPMVFSQPLTKWPAHGLKIRARAMDHHNGRTAGVTRAEIEDVEFGAADLDEPALDWIDPLQD